MIMIYMQKRQFTWIKQHYTHIGNQRTNAIGSNRKLSFEFLNLAVIFAQQPVLRFDSCTTTRLDVYNWTENFDMPSKKKK